MKLANVILNRLMIETRFDGPTNMSWPPINIILYFLLCSYLVIWVASTRHACLSYDAFSNRLRTFPEQQQQAMGPLVHTWKMQPTEEKKKKTKQSHGTDFFLS